MAGVTINIPNIGNVVADNAATEETLQKILSAIQKSGATPAAGGKKPGTTKEEKDLKQAREAETKEIQEGTCASKKYREEQSKTGKATTDFGNYLKDSWTKTRGGLDQSMSAVTSFGKTLALTAVSVASSWATSYEQMAKDPIGAAATMLATNIDLAGSAAKGAVDVGTGLVKAAGGFLGPFSGAVTGTADALNAAAKAAIDFATSVLKVANQVFANEFKKSTAMLADFTKSGASFAGGMTEMRNIAHDSGVMMDTFSNAVKASREEIRAMGMNQADGAKAVATGMNALKTTIGKSGNSVRDELLALGYSYEEQGQIVAQLGAQMKASGKDIRDLAPAELAQQTKDYAKNLKVISDITGQDAKKLMEKARQESMRGALMNKLTADQKEAFKGAHSTMAALGPEFQNALMQMLSGGTVTDPMIAGNAEAMEMIKKVAEDVQGGNKTIVADTQKAMSEAAEATRRRNEAEGNAADTAVLLGNNMGGVVKGFAEVTNKLGGFTLASDAAERSAEAADKQAAAQDSVTKGFQDITAQMTNFGVEMEKFASNNLASYATILANNAAETMNVMQEAIKVVRMGIKDYAAEKAKESGADPDRVGSALTGAAAGAVTGAVIGSVVPVIGTAVGTAVGGLIGGAAGWFSSNTAKNAEGGLATPGKLNIFGEAGPEAAVPLPDGRTIPVSMDFQNIKGIFPDSEATQSLTSGINNMVTRFSQEQADVRQVTMSKLDDTLKQMSIQFESLAKTLDGKNTEQTGIFSELSSHLKEMKDTAVKQLDINETIKGIMGDQKDISTGILNNIF